MKPRIIERLEELEQNIEAKISLIIDRLLTSGSIKAEGVLVGTVLSFSGDLDGVHPINPITRLADTSYVVCNGGSYFSKSLGGMIKTPDLRDRFIIGSGNSFLQGQAGGSFDGTFEVEVLPTTLTASQIPAHTHQVYMANMIGYTSTYKGFVIDSRYNPSQVASQYQETLATGGGAAHAHGGRVQLSREDKLTPYCALCYIMKI